MRIYSSKTNSANRTSIEENSTVVINQNDALI